MREQWVTEKYNYIHMGDIDDQFRTSKEMVSRMIGGETGIAYFTIADIDRIASFRPVSGSDGWSLGVVVPIAETPVSQIRQVLLISAAVFLGLGIIAAVFAANSVATPFKKIEEQNIRLEELRTSAENANEAKSRFLANMSHEMRTPLNAIIGLSELELGTGELSGEIYDNTEKIYNSGITLLGIINDLLDISKIESGKFELVPVEYDIPSLVNDTVNLNIVRIGSKPIKFRLHVDENLPARLFGDELRIKQIFNNLLSNAFKYTREGSVDWYLSSRKDGGKFWLQSRIQDTGLGIKEEDIPKLFSEYSQGDTKSNRKIEGSGLGLAISISIVRLMNGDNTVESEYGKGSVFAMQILQEPKGTEVIGKETAENLNLFNYTLQRRTRNQKLIRAWLPYASVLVVDDVDTNLDVARGMLKPYGMIVDCVTSGSDAIKRIREGKPKYNAIFMDHMMPGVDGTEATRIIREEIGTDYAKNIPIIALTADAIIGNDKLFLSRGFQAFLTKPIDIMLLDSVITRWVRNKDIEKELKEKSPELFTGKPNSDNARFREKKDNNTASRNSEKYSSLIEASKSIDGFDITNGLELVDNDIESWLEVIRSFVTHTPKLLDSMRDVRPETLSKYTVTVHGIKGSCYSLGARTVGEKAEDLEHKGRAGDIEFVERNNSDFISRAEKLLDNFRLLIKTAEEDNGKALKPAPDKDLLAKILDAAIHYDMEGLEKFIAALDQYRYERDDDLVPWLREQGSCSEFLAIQERLAKMLK
jgi:signal transduction histidine kinase/DNA-binding response OmpR family regulator